MRAPSSFSVDSWSDWESWVLDRALPDPPAVVGVDEAVPVAVWAAGGWAAVLTVSYVPSDPDGGDVASLDTECQTFRWSEGRWEDAPASGGGSWDVGLDLRRPDLDDRTAVVWHHGFCGTPDWSSASLFGVAGTAADTVEVEQDGRRRVRPLDSSLGAWVVAFDAKRPATVRVRAGVEILLEEHVVAQT